MDCPECGSVLNPDDIGATEVPEGIHVILTCWHCDSEPWDKIIQEVDLK